MTEGLSDHPFPWHLTPFRIVTDKANPQATRAYTCICL